MYKSFKFLNLISLILPLSIILLVSCSQNLPEINSTDYSVVFDYADEESLPTARLALFAASESDVRRYQRIKITSFETGYCWDTDLITKLDEEETQWAGCTNLVAPENEKLPTGTYEVTYYNADEKEYTLTLDVKYDIEFYDVLLSSLPELMKKNNGIEKIAVFDKDHILIYFGERTEEFKTTRDIWNKYPEAAVYQVIWYSSNGNVICLTPEKAVTPESDENKE